MLGLRLNTLTRRSRHLSATTPSDAANDTDTMPTTQPADAALSLSTPIKPEPAVHVKEVHVNESTENGTTVTTQQQSATITRTSSYKVTRVYDFTRTLKSRIIEELDEVDDTYFEGITFESYAEYIATERLIHMPVRGSQWDRILRSAEFFGYQMHTFGQTVDHFIPRSTYITQTALGSLWLLLEIGHHNAPALEPTFKVLHEFAHLIAQTVHRHEFLVTETIKEEVAELYTSFVSLVGDIAVEYRRRISAASAKGSAGIDFNATFGKTINRIWSKKEHIINHIWKHQLRNKECPMSIESLRRKLEPADFNVKATLYGRLTDTADRVDGTCQYLQSHLLDFLRSNDSTFTITGLPGTGKSMIAGWIAERLQRPLGRVAYETVAYTFPHDTKEQQTPLAFLKSILSQLLERNVGDVRLYDSLVAAFKKSSPEESLWSALEKALQSLEKEGVNMVVIVDGLDEASGKNAAAALHKRLHECVDRFPRARAITLSRSISHLQSTGTQKLVISLEANHGDITKYLQHSLCKNPHYDPSSEQFVEDLVTLGKGSFMHAFLAVKLLSFESSYDSFWKAGQSIPADQSALMKKIVAKMDMKNETTKHLIDFMLTATRPFSVQEMEDLLSIDLAKRTVRARTDVRKHVKAHCFGLIVERNGLLRFKHSTVQEYFAHHTSHNHKEAQADFTKRLLFYAKYALTSTHEPSFDYLKDSVVRDAFHSHTLLEYVVRHWLVHFRSSSFHGAKDEIHLSAEFKEIFPESTFFSMLEWSCWHANAADYDLTLRIRTACFGEQHRSVMQALVILGCFHRSTDVTRAGEFFYRASIIGRSVLYKFSTVVVACTTAFLTITETIVITKRTTIVTHREEMIRFMIEICTTKHGKASDHVIKWYKVLAKLYIAIKEEYRATIVYKELYEILLIHFGKDHPHVRDVTQTLGQLNITFTGEEELLKYNEFLFETAEESEENMSISVFWRLVATYEGQRKWVLAERLYIKFWQRISKLCRTKDTTEFHVLKIQVALAYVHFLQRIERIQEASAILIALWAEYEHREFVEQSIIIRIREIGVVCRSLSLFAVSIAIFTKVWSWFKSHGKTDHEEAAATIIQFTEVIEEYEETTVTKKTTTTTTTTVTETVTREIFETTYTRCKHGKVDAAFFKACKALITLYMKQERWSECEVVIKRSLELTWKAVLTVNTKLTLTGTFVKECIFVATQLGRCYHRQGFFEKAEELYLRVYHACIASFSIDHFHVTEASLVLIAFYEEYHRHDKVIEIYLGLLEGYRQHCGHSHALTIKTLYALGRICMMLGRKDAYEYYIEIVRVLNINQKACHHDAIEAALIVCGYYYAQSSWTKLREICSVLWETFIHGHHNFTETQIITLYERYTYVLEVHAKVEFSVLYKLSIQYKETVIKRFGVSSTIYITMLLALAKLYEKSEQHWHESVTIYEEIITKTTTTKTTTVTVEETIIRTVKRRLSKMYVTIITKGKSNTTTIERGITIALELYESLKIEFGCWHEKTLTQLHELCILYKTHGSKESHASILRLLQVSVIEVVSTTTTSFLLYQAAVSLAKIYVACGVVSTGRDLLHQLRHLILLHDLGSTKEITISLGSVSKVALAFLIAFEQGLTTVVYSYSEMMVDIMLEIHLKEEYTKIIKTETHIETILEVSARLRGFWFTRHRKIECELLDKRLFPMFVAKYGELANGNSDHTFAFYVAILDGLNVDRKKVDFAKVCCSAANKKVKALLASSHFEQAHEVARVAFRFIQGHHWYHNVHRVSYGYKLAELLAGIDVAHPSDKALRQKMLETSRKIVAETLAACRAAKIDFVSLRYEDLEGLVRLLGEQENYAELEILLESLYKSREVQKNWSSETVLSIGRLLVHAHYGAGHPTKAIELCDTLCYNLRRSRGWLDASSLAMSRLLAELYTAEHQHRKAMAVHEEVLRELDEDADDAEQGAGDKQQNVNEFVELLKRTFQRHGGWDKHERRYLDLYGVLRKRFQLTAQPIEQWSLSPKGADSRGCYHLPTGTQWRLETPKKSDDATKKRLSGSLRRIVARRSGGYDAFHEQLARTQEEA